MKSNKIRKISFLQKSSIQSVVSDKTMTAEDLVPPSKPFQNRRLSSETADMKQGLT